LIPRVIRGVVGCFAFALFWKAPLMDKTLVLSAAPHHA
jgi:hypothetical protein